jgi:Tfp pilus assembly protein PilF
MAPESNDGPNYGILTLRFMSAGQWDRSLATALEWLAKEPENLRAHRVAAQSLINLERTAEAEKHLEKVLAGNPNDGYAHRLMAMVYFKAGKFRSADDSIRKAISLNPTDAYHWHQLAHMSYRQGDLATARTSVAKARELNPRDANILNLAILCESNSAGTDKIEQFKEALALDPENANIYNNIGAQYLDKLKDYSKAEEYFRRALFFEPASRIFRKNLFITVKKRDLIYRVLCTPKDWLFAVINFFARTRKKNLLLYILMIPLWLLAFRFIIGGLILWFALVWPLTKVYEYLTIGDIRARAGELGVRRGGFLGYRKWPLNVRLSIFAFLLISFWGGMASFFVGKNPLADKEVGQSILGTILFLGVLAFLGYYLKLKINRGIKARAARKRARQMEGVLNINRGGEA